MINHPNAHSKISEEERQLVGHTSTFMGLLDSKKDLTKSELYLLHDYSRALISIEWYSNVIYDLMVYSVYLFCKKCLVEVAGLDLFKGGFYELTILELLNCCINLGYPCLETLIPKRHWMQLMEMGEQLVESGSISLCPENFDGNYYKDEKRELVIVLSTCKEALEAKEKLKC